MKGFKDFNYMKGFKDKNFIVFNVTQLLKIQTGT